MINQKNQVINQKYRLVYYFIGMAIGLIQLFDRYGNCFKIILCYLNHYDVYIEPYASNKLINV
jgi:hypothetical protein